MPPESEARSHHGRSALGSARAPARHHGRVDTARFLPPAEAHRAEGAAVVVDVLRAFTTAAAAFAAGAEHIVLVGTVEEALALKRANPGWLAMGEAGGRWIEGFDLSNSPFQTLARELTGAVIVQRTGAGTQGVIACS